MADTLDNLGSLLQSDNSRKTEVEGFFREELSIYRQLAKENPAAYLPSVVTTLDRLGVLVSDDSRRRAEAQGLFREALTACWQMAQEPSNGIFWAVLLAAMSLLWEAMSLGYFFQLGYLAFLFGAYLCVRLPKRQAFQRVGTLAALAGAIGLSLASDHYSVIAAVAASITGVGIGVFRNAQAKVKPTDQSKQPWFGIVSFVTSIVSALLMCVTFLYGLGIYFIASWEKEKTFPIVVLFMVLFFGTSLVALGLGIVGLFREKRKKLLALLGTACSVATIALIVYLIMEGQNRAAG